MEILGLILLVSFCAVCLTATLEAITLLFPTSIEDIQKTLDASLGRSFLLGIVNFVFFSTIVLLLIWLTEQVGPVLSSLTVLLGLLILVFLVAFILSGLSALAGLLGQRMDGKKPPVAAQRRGAILLILVGLTPFVGWFVFTPLLLSMGLGAGLQTYLQRRAAKKAKNSETS